MSVELIIGAIDLSPYIGQINFQSPITPGLEDTHPNIWIHDEPSWIFPELHMLFRHLNDPVTFFNGDIFRARQRYGDVYRILIGDSFNKSHFFLVSANRFNDEMTRIRSRK